MKKFILNKIAGEEIVYRNGESPIEILIPGLSKCIKIITIDKCGDVLTHFKSGRFLSEDKESTFDLFFKKRKKFKSALADLGTTVRNKN